MAYDFIDYVASPEHPCDVCGGWPDDDSGDGCPCEPCPACGQIRDPQCLYTCLKGE